MKRETHTTRALVEAPDGARAHLAKIVEALRHPATYPDAVSRIDAIETHMSWVFLTDAHAWKLKKPIRTATLDFTTLEGRRRACEVELALNRRLAPDVYLGVVPLIMFDGIARLGGVGEPAEWLVQMRRLPHDRMLDACIARGTVSPDDIDRLATTLARFYGTTERAPIGGAAYRRAIVADIASKCASIEQPRYGLRVDSIRAASAGLERWLAQHGAMLDARGAHVVDAHGDLRPEHICLEAPLAKVIDCLEFNRNLRLLDPLSELAFLALECRRLGSASVGERVLARCSALMGEQPDAGLISFYQSCHALIRAAVAVWHLDDDALDRSDSWQERGAWYVDVARTLL